MGAFLISMELAPYKTQVAVASQGLSLRHS